MSHTVQAFFAALAKRRLNLKTAAYLGGGHPKTLERLQRGETRTLDASFVARLADKLEDGSSFVAEVFGPHVAAADPLAAIRTDVAEIRRAVAAQAAGDNGTRPPAAWWFDENGRRFAALPDLETAARLALNLPHGIDAAAFAQRNLGWVAVDCGKIVPNDAPAALAAEAAASFVGVPKFALPRGWQADAVPLVSEQRPALRRLVSANGIGEIRDALFGAQLLDRASLYAVDADRVTTIWLGRDLKTTADAIGRPLAARTDRPFAAMLESQIRATASGGAQLWHLANIQTCGVRASWDRISVPTRDRRFVAHVVEFKQVERLELRVQA
jgi:hypothetical protein